MPDEVVIRTEPEDPDAATPEEVSGIVREAIHDEHVRDTLEDIRDGDEERWQAFQMEITSLSERVGMLETTLSASLAATQAVAEEVQAVEEVVEDLVQGDGETDPDEIVLEPEPEPEPEKPKQEGFSPLRKLLG